MAEMTVDMIRRAYRDTALRIVNQGNGKVTVAVANADTPHGVMELDNVQESGSNVVFPRVLQELKVHADDCLPFVNLLEQYETFPVTIHYAVDLQRKDIATILKLGMKSCQDWLVLDHAVRPNRLAAYCPVEEVLTYGGTLVFRAGKGELYPMTLWDFQGGFRQWMIGGGDWNRAVQNRQILLDRMDETTAELILRLALHVTSAKSAGYTAMQG